MAKECIQLKERTINDSELELLKNATELISNDKFQTDIGTSLELIDKIKNDDLNNGVVLLNSEHFIAMPSLLANYCIQKYNTKRILVINWDTEHNTQLQNDLYTNQKVLCCSIHRFESGKSADGSDFYNNGDESGKGFNINVPLTEAGYGDQEYMALFLNLLLPIFYEFSPQIIIVPSSFNANTNGQMNVSSTIFEHFLNYLTCLANGKICLLINVT